MAAKQVEELRAHVKEELRKVEQEMMKLNGLLGQYEARTDGQTAELQRVSTTIVTEVGAMRTLNETVRAEAGAWMRTAEIALEGLNKRGQSAGTSTKTTPDTDRGKKLLNAKNMMPEVFDGEKWASWKIDLEDYVEEVAKGGKETLESVAKGEDEELEEKWWWMVEPIWRLLRRCTQ